MNETLNVQCAPAVAVQRRVGHPWGLDPAIAADRQKIRQHIRSLIPKGLLKRDAENLARNYRIEYGLETGKKCCTWNLPRNKFGIIALHA